MPQGTVVATQVANDCKKRVCDGTGNIAEIADPSDLPEDGNACTLDQCTGSGPTNTSAPLGTKCDQNGGTACDGKGACVKLCAFSESSSTFNNCVFAP